MRWFVIHLALINNLIVDMERISDRKDRESNENTRVEATANGVF